MGRILTMILAAMAGLGILAGGPWGCEKNDITGPITIVQPVTVIATPPPGTLGGRDWTYATLAAPFPGRGFFGSLVYNNRMWVIGGVNGSHYFNDVWYSPF